MKHHIDFAIYTALSDELTPLKSELAAHRIDTGKISHFDFDIYHYQNKNILLTSTGIGTSFAACTLTLINEHFHPAYHLLMGTAGGVAPHININDVVIIDACYEAEMLQVHQHIAGTPFEACFVHPLKQQKSPDIYPANPALLTLCHKISIPDITIHQGTAVTSNAFPAPKEIYADIKKNNVLSIDMETSAFYQTAWLLDLNVIAVRGISNVLNHEGHDENLTEADLTGSCKNAANVVLAMLILKD